MKTLEAINVLLWKIYKDEPAVYKKYQLLEREYLKVFDTYMLTDGMQLGNQTLRDSATRDYLRKNWDKYDKYLDAQMEYSQLYKQRKLLEQISNNIRSGNWSNQ